MIIRVGRIIPGIEQAAKSLPKTKELDSIHTIRTHKVKTARYLVFLIPNTIGKVRSPAFLSPIISSPSFNISLGKLIQNIKEAGKIEFFRLRKAAEAIAPTINVIESSNATVILPIKGRFFRNGVYIISSKVEANPIADKLKEINKRMILPVIKSKTTICNALFFVIFPEGINLSGLLIASTSISKKSFIKFPATVINIIDSAARYTCNPIYAGVRKPPRITTPPAIRALRILIVLASDLHG